MAQKTECLPNQTLVEYSVMRNCPHDTGLVQVGGLGPEGTPCIFARIRAPQECEVVIWSAKCENGMPQVPSPYGPLLNAAQPPGLNANMVFLRGQLGVPVPMVIGPGAGGHVVIITGTYYYGKFTPDGVVRNYSTGKLPYEQQGVDYNALPAANFVQGILDPTQVGQVPDPGLSLQTAIQGP